VTAQITNAPITKAQVKAIHVALHRRGIDDETYRHVLDDRFGATTCKDLTRREASELLTLLGRPLPRPPGTRPHSGTRRRIETPAEPQPVGDGVIQLATKAQRDLIGALAAEIMWETEDGYRRWLRRSIGLARVRTSAEAARAIEGLRGLKAHGHAKEETTP